MTYVMSDVHGYYELYLDFLRDSGFSDQDMLYIVGDVLDRGSSSIKLLLDIMKRDNVVLIKGNHEQMIKDTFEQLVCENSTSQAQIIDDELTIAQIGQRETLEDFCKLDTATQQDIIYYLSNLELYAELEVAGKNYLLVHAGLPDFSDMPIEFYDEHELVSGEHDFDETHYEDTTIIVGHKPTRFIHGAEPDEIFHGKDTIAMDCGLGFGGQLGVLCLDNMEEEYYSF